ncbi:hypothetical protein [Alteribacter aurantiacus]|uniref:hypothetical protein n=1 Tax=Alteribacter aurantiacus TaxID=254410 RepID=UPI000400734A|nr:hypothetical protein [Alteribacter aurantiacus]
MIKKGFVSGMMLGTFLLGACVAETGKNTLIEASLTDREEAILAGSEDAFVFDFNVDGTYSEVELRMERYDFGKVADSPAFLISINLEGEGSIVFTSSHLIDQEDALFTTSVSSGDLIGTHQTVETIFRDGADGMAKISQTHLKPEVPIEGDMVLATILYSSKDTMSSLPDGYTDDPKDYQKYLEEYDVAYVLKSIFR